MSAELLFDPAHEELSAISACHVPTGITHLADQRNLRNYTLRLITTHFILYKALETLCSFLVIHYQYHYCHRYYHYYYYYY